ncbi:MAG: hypothetical protein R3C99_03810 [Pirellulaceae bacterium]
MVCPTLVGEVILLDLVELGAEGPATVTAIESCPPIETRGPMAGG